MAEDSIADIQDDDLVDEAIDRRSGLKIVMVSSGICQ